MAVNFIFFPPSTIVKKPSHCQKALYIIKLYKFEKNENKKKKKCNSNYFIFLFEKHEKFSFLSFFFAN